MEEIAKLTHLAFLDVTVEKMMTEWNTIFHRDILPIYNETKDDPELFVIKVHEYLRVKKNIGYEKHLFNVFLTIINQEKCNCLCSAIFILLSCYEVGYFPNYVLGALIPEHIFIISKDFRRTFETTRSCTTNWEHISEFYDYYNFNPNTDLYSVIWDINALISAYAMSIYILIDNSLKSKSKNKDITYDIITKYFNPVHPQYFSSRIIKGSNSLEDISVLVPKFIDYITRYQLEATFAVTPFLMMTALISTVEDGNASIDDISGYISQLYQLLLKAQKNNPTNKKINVYVTDAKFIFDNVFDVK